MQITKDQGGSLLKIAGAVEIGVAEELRRELCDSLDGSSRLVVDLSGIDACDAAALQLFCSVRKSAERLSKVVEFGVLPEAVVRACDDLGLSVEELTGCTEGDGSADAR